MKKPIVVAGMYIENIEPLLEILTDNGKDHLIKELNNLLYKYSLLTVEYLGREFGKPGAEEAAGHIYLLKRIIESVEEAEITQILEND